MYCKNRTIDKPACRAIVALMVEHGIKNVVISPGSRNTPLIIALDQVDAINKYVVIDERSAAYIALGMIQILQEPVAVVCTSGSALLNYAPAVCEAYYQSLPLIVISADRPMQWIDQDDSQTIRQFEALKNFVKQSYNIPDFKNDGELFWYANRQINDAFLTATKERQGPIHINMEFNLPLSNYIEKTPEIHRKISFVKINETISIDSLSELVNYIHNKKVMIIAGYFQPNGQLNAAIDKLSHRKNIVVLSESIANLKGENIISTIDRTIAPLMHRQDDIDNIYMPDVVISFGGALISRHIKQLLRSNKKGQHWSIGKTHTTVDCFQTLTKKIEISPVSFFKQFSMLLDDIDDFDSDYATKWHDLYAKSKQSHEKFINESKWSDFKAFSIIMPSIPKDTILQLSNGTSIRYAQLFDNKHIASSYCNRGVSGIDGCTSTALGASVVSEKQIIFISGDMSFSYDIGALSSDLISNKFKIIVINNNGGGIFKFIPTTSKLGIVDKYFSKPPILPLEQLSRAYNFDYLCAKDEIELKIKLQEFYDIKNRSVILEVVTPDKYSAELLHRYMNRINN